WRQDDTLALLDQASKDPLPAHFDREALVSRLRPGLVGLPLGPLMHGAAYNNTMSVLKGGGAVVFLSSRNFDAASVWNTVEREKVKTISIIGDAMAKPLLSALAAEP